MKGVDQMLEERAITAGTVTRHGLQAMLDSTVSKAIEESGMKEAIDALSGQRAKSPDYSQLQFI